MLHIVYVCCDNFPLILPVTRWGRVFRVRGIKRVSGMRVFGFHCSVRVRKL